MKTFRTIYFVWITLCLTLLPLMAQEETLRLQQAFERIDKLVEQSMRESKTPGMALAVTSRSGLLRLANYGYADKDARKPVTRETLFGTGSIGKGFTSVAIMQ